MPSSDTSSSGEELTFSNCVKKKRKKKAVITVSHHAFAKGTGTKLTRTGGNIINTNYPQHHFDDRCSQVLLKYLVMTNLHRSGRLTGFYGGPILLQHI